MSDVKAKLLAARSQNTETVTVEGFGDLVVRGLTRAEVLSIQKAGEMDAAEMERRLISFAGVEPTFTEDEVRQWQEVSPAMELEKVSEAIQRLSGLGVRVKDEMQRFR